MALVVFLRGVNVGGHRTFRPAMLARNLEGLDVVNIGAAGTFVVRRPVSRTQLRAELAGRLPFEADMAICDGREITGLVSRWPVTQEPEPPDVVRFVSVRCRRVRRLPLLPITIPSEGPWLVKILGSEGRCVFGLYRRRLEVVGHLGRLDRLLGSPVTTRNWNTMTTIARVLQEGTPSRGARRR